MPIYEFYCPVCNRIFQFFSVGVDTETVPDCPKCGGEKMERRVSRFAVLKHSGEDEEPTPFDNLDEEKMEGAMTALMGEMGSEEEMEDPRKAAGFMRKFMEMTGMEMGPKMEEMVHRMESGEDPEDLEAEFGDDMNMEDDGAMDEFFRFKKAIREKKHAPTRDEKLYFL